MRRVLLVVLLTACDESVVFHEPDPSWNRMQQQPRLDPYEPSALFDDGQAMRRPPPGTRPRDGEPMAPPPVTRELLALGRHRFETFCAACHGIVGDGVSVVAEKMTLRKPPSLHEARLAARAPDAFVKTIEEGFGLMPSYADALSRRERWAIGNYVKALQLSRAAHAAELAPALRAELFARAP